MEFKDRLRELRLEKSLYQSQVGQALNVSNMAVSHWELGDCEPSIEQLKTLSKLFEVSVDYLIGNDEL